MRLILATVLAVLTLLPAVAGAQDTVLPTVTTGPAEPVGPTTATLTGSVDPNGTATAHHFDYGTTTAYESATVEQSSGADEDELAVQAQLENLTPSTTYHYRLVAGEQAGDDRTFKTAAAPIQPTPPSIYRLAAAEKTSSSARLTARINPRRAATTFHVEWGTSVRLGKRTAEQALPAGRRGIAVSVTLDGLLPHRRIFWRVVAVNAVGITRSGTASFTTPRALTGATLSLFPTIAGWSGPVSISGRLEGAGLNGVRVALEQASFPFDAGFHEVAKATADYRGEFRFPARAVFLATQFRAVTRGALVVSSPPVMARVRSRVALRATARTRRSLRLVGDVSPGRLDGQAALQRRTRRGGWVRVDRAALRARDALRSSYRFSVRRLRRAAVYRVKVPALGSGANLTGYSREMLVNKQPVKRKRENKRR